MLRISAPAKINLYLHITGKRSDGYHLLDSLVAFTEYGDVLEITSSERLELTVTGPFAASLSEDNLVMRAARLLQEYTGCKKGAQITLHKNIPIGAGLGGGSSDAAAALLGLQKLWGVTLASDKLQELALKLGSDVPVCLLRKTSRVGGIGDEVTPVAMEWDKHWLVLVNPNVPLLTADVYRRFSGPFSLPSAPPHNDLEAPAIVLLPVVADVLSAIHRSGCELARMSGSGATCFGLYESEEAAQIAAQNLQQQHPDWWIQSTGWYKD